MVRYVNIAVIASPFGGLPLLFLQYLIVGGINWCKALKPYERLAIFKNLLYY